MPFANICLKINKNIIGFINLLIFTVDKLLLCNKVN